MKSMYYVQATVKVKYKEKDPVTGKEVPKVRWDSQEWAFLGHDRDDIAAQVQIEVDKDNFKPEWKFSRDVDGYPLSKDWQQ